MKCYFLTVCSGSSIDQQSNNATLFNLVEQINVPPDAPSPPNGVLPLEIHAYFQFATDEAAQTFEIRFVMVASGGLETPSDPFSHHATAGRFHTRTMGVPLPPVVGQYELRVDWRRAADEPWTRSDTMWPMTIAEARPMVTH